MLLLDQGFSAYVYLSTFPLLWIYELCGSSNKTLSDFNAGKSKISTVTIIVAIVVPVAVAVGLLILCYCFLSRRESKKFNAKKASSFKKSDRTVTYDGMQVVLVSHLFIWEYCFEHRQGIQKYYTIPSILNLDHILT